MTDTEECDRCGAAIILDPWERPSPFQFVHETGEADDDGAPVYEQEQRILCSGCEDDLLEWIDEGDIDRSDCVDLPTAVEAAQTLKRTSNTLDQLAMVLESELDGDEA